MITMAHMYWLRMNLILNIISMVMSIIVSYDILDLVTLLQVAILFTSTENLSKSHLTTLLKRKLWDQRSHIKD